MLQKPLLIWEELQNPFDLLKADKVIVGELLDNICQLNSSSVVWHAVEAMKRRLVGGWSARKGASK